MSDLLQRYEGSCNHGITVTDTMTMEGECKECGASIEWVVPVTIDRDEIDRLIHRYESAWDVMTRRDCADSIVTYVRGAAIEETNDE